MTDQTKYGKNRQEPNTSTAPCWVPSIWTSAVYMLLLHWWICITWIISFNVYFVLHFELYTNCLWLSSVLIVTGSGRGKIPYKLSLWLSLPKWKCVLEKLLIILCKIEIKTSYITLGESCSLDIEPAISHIGAGITIFRVRRLRPTCLLLVFSYLTLLI